MVQKVSLRRHLRAQWRDLRVLFHESRFSLLLFVGVVLVGALLIHLGMVDPQSGRRMGMSRALYGTLSLIFFNSEVLGFPQQPGLQILFFLIPVLGLAAGAESVLRLGSALVNKGERGQKWQVAMASTYNKHVVVCGLGKVGYRVVQELLRYGRAVVGVEINPEGRFVEATRALGIPVIIADARRTENLVKAGVKVADAIIPCTDDELANLDTALDARELNPQIHVVMRLFDPDLARRIEKGFGIHTALSTSALAAPLFAAAAMRVDVQYAFYLGDTLLSLSELTVAPGSQLDGWTVERLEKGLDLSVICYHKDDCTDLHPDGALRLTAGEKIVVLAGLDTLQRLQALNGAG
jgi:voltage-gated potassium channel